MPKWAWGPKRAWGQRHRDRTLNLELETLEASARRASALLKAMGNTHRLMILCQLSKGERNVGELERIVGLSQSALSQHLARLRNDNLVKTRRAAQTIYYSLAGEEAAAVIDALCRLYGADDARDVQAPIDAEDAGAGARAAAAR